MKTLPISLSTITFTLISLCGISQSTLSCADFSITSVAPDESNPDFTLISIQMLGSTSDFINYPYVTSVSDCDGNTIASGSMFFFGQMGQTTQAYPVSAFGNDVCFPITAEFFFGNVDFENDTCLLTFDGSGLFINTKMQHTLSVFPNPASGEIQMNVAPEMIGTEYSLFDSMGRMVLSGVITTPLQRIDLGAIPKGVYVMRVANQEIKILSTQ